MSNDYLMSYEDSCDRVPVLWIHGFPLNNMLWDLQVQGLADIARLITPDLRGHGLSDATPAPHSMQMYAEDCVRLLDELGITGPVVVAGLSMGGYVAFELCRRYPERVAGLILAATRAGADSPEAKAKRDAATAGIQADGVGPLVEGMLPNLLAPENFATQTELVSFAREMMMKTSAEGAIGALAAMRDRPNSEPDLPGLAVPTLILHGTEDQLIPVSDAVIMQEKIPAAEMVVIPGAGHLPNLEQPVEFDEAVRGFLEMFYQED